MAAALLDHMDVSGQDGLVAKDLVDWYMTSDHYNPVSGGEVAAATAGSDGKEVADGSNEAAVAEMKSQLLNVLRRMIKRDKSIMAVKSTVKGSKRIEDMLLKKSSQPEANENKNGLKVSQAAAAGVVDSEAEADQVVKLKKQIEEKKAALAAKAATVETEGEDEDAVKPTAADDGTAVADATVVPKIMKASDYTGKA